MPQQWQLVHPYAMPPHFTGRVDERQMLSDWLEGDAEHPLFVLRALGGFGKSALTWYWLTHDVDKGQWPAVVWWSFYEAQAGFDNFLRRTLKYLIGEEPKTLNPREQVEKLLDCLKQQRVLLVMDGFERELRAYSSMGAAYQGDGEQELPDNDRDCVNPDAEQFLRNLCSLPGLKGKVLMSTRLRPRPVEVTGGMLLAGCREEELKRMQREDAVQFFRVQGIRGNRGEIEQACEAYGCHPLSLRLLAGWVLKDFRNPGDIQAAQRLDVTGSLVQRQHHVLEQSYESLNEPGRKLLSRLACFRSPVEYDVLEALANDEAELQQNLQDLIARGLVQQEQSRFDLHPIVRRYAYDRMGNEERRQTHGQLRDYFSAVPKAKQVNSIYDLAPVIELYHHMARAEQYNEAWKLFCARLNQPLFYRFGAYQKQIELLRALFTQDGQKLPQFQNERAQEWILNELGNSYSLSGQPAQAVPLYEQGIVLSEKLGHEMNLAIGLAAVASSAYLALGALQTAEANLRRTITLSQEIIKNEFQEAIGYLGLGLQLTYRGAWTEGEKALERSLQLAKQLTAHQIAYNAWFYKALSLLIKGRCEADPLIAKAALSAAQSSLKSADEFVRIQQTPVESFYIHCHWVLGSAHRLIPSLTDSDHHLTEALRRCRAINNVEHEANILLDLARLRRDQGNPSEALRLAEDAQRIATRCGYVLQGADIHLFLAEQAITAGNPAEALDYAKEARRLATCDDGDYTYKVAYDEAGELLEQLGESPD